MSAFEGDHHHQKELIHRKLVELSDSLLETMNNTQKIIKNDLDKLRNTEFCAENRLESVSKEEKLIKEFNTQSNYGRFYVWIVLIICTLVFFFVIFLIRVLG